MTYRTFTLGFVITGFLVLEFIASNWYSAILPDAQAYEFLIPMMVALWVVLQFQADALLHEKRWLVIAKKGIVAGAACAFVTWSALLIRSPEIMISMLTDTLQFGVYAFVILLAFQIILGGWFIGLASYFVVHEGCILFKFKS